MDVVLNFAALIILAIPMGVAGAAFLRVGPEAFGALSHRGPSGWPRGMQEEDPEAAWASRVGVPPEARPERRSEGPRPSGELTRMPLERVRARVRGPGRRR